MNDLNEYELKVSKTIKCTVVAAFAAFTRPEELSIWFTKQASVDLKVGGKYSNSDNDKGTYLTIDPPHHLRFTWDNKDHCPGTEVDVRFSESEEGITIVLLKHTKLSSQKGRDDMMEGWSWAMDCVAKYLETGLPISFEDWKANQS